MLWNCKGKKNQTHFQTCTELNDLFQIITGMPLFSKLTNQITFTFFIKRLKEIGESSFFTYWNSNLDSNVLQTNDFGGILTET